MAHLVWGGGFLGPAGVGALDFAGGTVVHINAGIAALACVIYLKPRRGFGSQAFVPHNVPMVVLGGAVLWFGWFGFNAGSALGANGLSSSAFVATHLGAAAATLGWLIPERIKHGKATTLGAVTGAVAGLVAITPASGFVTPMGALAIGFAAGIICFYAVNLKSRFGYDDSLDVVGVHLVGGIVGALLTGVFASLAINPAGADGGLTQLGKQAAAVGVSLLFSFVVTMIILKVVDLIVGLRVDEESEVGGLDLSQHGEVAYTWTERGGSLVHDDGSVKAAAAAVGPEHEAIVLDEPVRGERP
jgi:Amt family ammonium transporter